MINEIIKNETGEERGPEIKKMDIKEQYEIKYCPE